jgi:hypothetical protein
VSAKQRANWARFAKQARSGVWKRRKRSGPKPTGVPYSAGVVDEQGRPVESILDSDD